ncbi:GlxA family transcriptional regulator [Pseudomonas sp. SP16.1]|uniref:GlxA family transcriptional regulator n=1 Tax=Pseudomonas sp. SP16.1 TaxID=3458854 RepID=UPI004046442A
MTSFEKVPAVAAVESIGFLLVEQFSLVALAAALEPLRLANQLAGRSLYRWQTLSLDGRPLRASNGMWVTPDGAATGGGQWHGLILCGSDGVQDGAWPELERYLQAQARPGLFLGALGSGSLTLARAGLLEGYQCSTSWRCRVDLQRAFPGVALSARPFVVDRDRATAAGGGAGLELMLQLIAGRHGQVLLRAIAETLAFELVRCEPLPAQLPPHLCGDALSPKLREVIGLMEANLEEPLELGQLAGFVALSRRQLERLFEKHLQCSPARYYLRLRLVRARQLLRRTRLSVIEVAAACGFLSAQTFSRCYREHFGLAPSSERPSHLAEAVLH